MSKLSEEESRSMWLALSFSPELQELFFKPPHQDTGKVIARQDPRVTVTVKNNQIVIEVRPFPKDDPSLSFTMTTDAGLNPDFDMEESYGPECYPPLPRVTTETDILGSENRPHTLGWAEFPWPRPAHSSSPLFWFYVQVSMWKFPKGGLCVKFECKHDKDGHNVTDTFLAMHPPPSRKRPDSADPLVPAAAANSPDIAAAPKKQKVADWEAKHAAKIQTGIINASDLAADGTYTGSDIALKGGTGVGRML